MKEGCIMSVCRVFIPYGSIGLLGMSDAEFDRGLAMKLDVIAVDAGSTDSGPYYLGTGQCKYADNAVKRDIRQCIIGAHKLKIPVLIGSLQTSGTDGGVDYAEGLVREICAEEGLHEKKVVKIYTEQDPKVLKRKYLEGKIFPLANAPEIDENTFEQCKHIVALGGAEPFIEALKQGADIVLCGRCTDTAVIAAMPEMMGCNVAAAWHGAKVTECGPQCTDKWQIGGGVVLTVDDEGFEVEPTSEDSRCTPFSTSAHMIYENADPFRLTEPAHILDVTEAVYTPVNDRKVRVTGSRLGKKPYTMKLEGVAATGYQTICIVGIQDRDVMIDPMLWSNSINSYMDAKLKEAGYPKDDYICDLRLYGWNAISNQYIEPGSYIPKEIGVMLVVTAKTQELAMEIAKAWNPQLLHHTVKKGNMATFAFPFSPNEINRGVLYEFMLNHAVMVDSPMELVRMETLVID
jgi:hypothetical protein